MSIGRHVLRDGEWVMETVDVQNILKSQVPKPALAPPPNTAPKCGLLTRTVVETELAHFILPVRLRSSSQNDVAFVGDHFVQIRELQADGQLLDVLRKNDFGSRIRNAVVYGGVPDFRQEETDQPSPGAPVKCEDGDVIMDLDENVPGVSTPTPRSTHLPPQMLVLVLESGDTVFLYIRDDQDETLRFEVSRFTSPLSKLVKPDFHMTIDPSSRYLALGCAEKSFVIYELGCLKTHSDFKTPVATHMLRSVQGVIHKMQFLYPRPGDDRHIILLLIVVGSRGSRLVTYEWERGDNLKDVFADEKTGHRLGPDQRLPLMIIPLTVCSAFISVSEKQVAVCADILHASPRFESVTIEEGRPPTDNFHGRKEPLWVAWARPVRLPEYFATHDCIYLAREDGVVFFVEADLDNTVTGSLYIDKVDCNISTAFTCLYDQFDDVLVMGSASSPGAVWKVPARRSPVRLSTLPNWAPVVDLTTTDEYSTWNPETNATGSPMTPWPEKKLTKPDRIFGTSGKGSKGTVTEYRYGLQAKIGLQYECGMGVKRAFVLPALAAFFGGEAPGYDLILSMGDQTRVLRLSEDFGEIAELQDGDATLPYNLSCQTITAATACESADVVVQVTAQNIVLTNGRNICRLSADKFGGAEAVTILDAAVTDRYIAISAYSGTQFRLHVLRIEDTDSLHVSTVNSYDVEGEVTCLSLCQLEEKNVLELQAGFWHQARPLFGRARIGGDMRGTEEGMEILDSAQFSTSFAPATPPRILEAIDSIASCVREGEQYTTLGFRSGEVVTLLVHQDGTQCIHVDRLGEAVARVCVASEMGAKPLVLISTGSDLTLVSGYESQGFERAGPPKTKHRVWPVDVARPDLPCPPVDSVTVLSRSLMSDNDKGVPLLLISGGTLSFAELQLQPGPPHRHIPLAGTPDRIIYSHRLKCLIVALRKSAQQSMPTLAFIDPDTGEDIGVPSDKHGNVYEFARGLGKPDDKVMSLAEWEYRKDGHVWHFLIMGMYKERLMVMSVERDKEGGDGQNPKIRYWTRFQRKGLGSPVYAVLGHDDTLIYCVGTSIVWETIDAADKRLREIGRYELASPATTLRLANGRLAALCNSHGVEIIDIRPNNGDGTRPDAACLLHSDPAQRQSVHMIEVSGSADNEPASSLMLVSDAYCSVGGLWTPWHSPGRDCERVFEVELPASIRRFARGRTRLPWEQGDRGRPRYGRIAMTADDAEILGVCLDGTLMHFQLLDLAAWRLMRFILNLSVTDPVVNPFNNISEDDMENLDPEPVPRMDDMQIDGDELQRCVQARALERLMAGHLDHFKELLDELDDRKWSDEIVSTTDAEEDAGYFALAYRILQYFLAPVL